MDTPENIQCGLTCRPAKRLLGKILVDGEFVSTQDIEKALEQQRYTSEFLGETLVRMGSLDPLDLKVALAIQTDLSSLEDAVKAAAGPYQMLGKLLLRAKHITPDQLNLAIEEQQRTGEKLGEVLVRLKFLKGRELAAALAFQKRLTSHDSKRFSLGEILVEADYITREQLEDALARQELTDPEKIGEVLVEAGYVQPHHISHALDLQNKLVTAALIAALSLGSLHSADAAQSDGIMNASGSTMTVSATVRAYSDLKVISQPSELIVTNADIVRGYIDVPIPTKIEIKNNVLSGYLLAFEGLAEPFKEVQIHGLGRDVYINSSNGWVDQPYSRGTVELELSYRFVLSERPQPGTYVWPLTISVIPK